MEESRHQQGCHDGVDEEQGARDACRHVMKTHVKSDGRQGEEGAQECKLDGVSPFDGETLSAYQHDKSEHQYSQTIPIAEYRPRVEAVFIQLEGS